MNAKAATLMATVERTGQQDWVFPIYAVTVESAFVFVACGIFILCCAIFGTANMLYIVARFFRSIAELLEYVAKSHNEFTQSARFRNAGQSSALVTKVETATPTGSLKNFRGFGMSSEHFTDPLAPVDWDLDEESITPREDATIEEATKTNQERK